MRYRADIDGLRALAVMPVVLFHANVPGFGGGFVGVDIFFVISGFLITSIIAEEITQGRFSIVAFYERRIRRIFPALFAVLLVSSILAIWLLLPNQFDAYSRSVLGTAFFASNIVFWRETGYFAAPASEKPLLHTWSLAVEEQFYVFLPLLLLFIYHWLNAKWTVWIVLLTILSFALSIWGVAVKPSATFYLAPTRAWELLLGSILALGAIPTLRSRPLMEALFLVGAGSIAWGIFGLSVVSPFPGLNALFPCIGAALVIYSGQNTSLYSNWFLRSKPFVFVGFISYSLYLWHWPLLVFGQIWNVYELTSFQTTAIVSLSFLAATLSWKYVESPFRKRGAVLARKGLFSTAFAAICVLLIFGTYGVVTHGWPERVPAKSVEIAKFTKSHNPRRNECLLFPGNPVMQPCIYGASVQPAYAVWGDSHADATIHAIGNVAKAKGQSVLFLGSASCPPFIGVRIQKYDCLSTNVAFYERIVQSDHIKTVILVARYAVYVQGRARALGPAERSEISSVYITDVNGAAPDLEGRLNLFSTALEKTVNELLSAGKKIVLVYPIPEVGYDVPVTLAQIVIKGQPPESFTRTIDHFWERQRSIFKMLDNLGQSQQVLRLYPHKQLCNAERCITYSDGNPLYRDDDHLSLAGAEFIAPIFRAIFEEAGTPTVTLLP